MITHIRVDMKIKVDSPTLFGILTKKIEIGEKEELDSSFSQ